MCIITYLFWQVWTPGRQDPCCLIICHIPWLCAVIVSGEGRKKGREEMREKRKKGGRMHTNLTKRPFHPQEIQTHFALCPTPDLPRHFLDNQRVIDTSLLQLLHLVILQLLPTFFFLVVHCYLYKCRRSGGIIANQFRINLRYPVFESFDCPALLLSHLL